MPVVPTAVGRFGRCIGLRPQAQLLFWNKKPSIFTSSEQEPDWTNGQQAELEETLRSNLKAKQPTQPTGLGISYRNDSVPLFLCEHAVRSE